MLKKINWNKVLSILGFLVFLISIIVIWGTYEKMNIDKNGKVIIANIIEAPEDCSKVTSRNGFCKLEYKGKIYIKRAGRKFCHLVSGEQKVEMLSDDNYKKVLFLKEFEYVQFFYGFIIMAISILIIRKGITG